MEVDEVKRNWKKLPALAKLNPNPCLHCPDPPAFAPMAKIIAVGFGVAEITCDGELVADGERSANKGKWLTFKDAERCAANDPNHDWRVVLHGPLHGETYQRHGKKQWVCVEQNRGFA